MRVTLATWALVVAGSALILTQSVIARPLRDYLAREAERRQGRAGDAARALAKIAHCPMCSGAWLGAGWALAGGFDAAGVFWLAFGGSYVAAIAVALWQFITESKAALELWRFLSTPEDE